jgi:hypothetical protein
MKPAFEKLRLCYPRTGTREVLFGSIGWTDLTNNPAYFDTCAIRMSVGLLGAGRHRKTHRRRVVFSNPCSQRAG